MGHPPPPQLCLKHLPGMTLHLPLSPSLWGHLDRPPPRGQQRRRQIQAAGQAGEGWQGQRHGKGETQEWKRLHAHCGRRLGGSGQGLQSSYILPSRVWSSSSDFVTDGRGRRGKSPFPTTPTGTQTHARLSLILQGSTARWTTSHSRTNNHSPAPPQPSLPLLPAAVAPRNSGCPRFSPLTRSSLQARGSRQGERRRKGGSEGRGTAKGRRRELRTAIRTTTSPPMPLKRG